MSTTWPFLRSAFWMGGALLIWAVHFLVGYVTASLACARGMEPYGLSREHAVFALASVSSLVALAACGLLLRVSLVRARRLPEADPQRFVLRVASAASLLALIGITGTAAMGLLPLQCEIPALPAHAGQDYDA